MEVWGKKNSIDKSEYKKNEEQKQEKKKKKEREKESFIFHFTKSVR